MIETTEMTGLTLRLPGLNGALRIWSAARALLALLGLAVVLAAALPAPREALLRQLAAWAEAWDEEVSSVPAVTRRHHPARRPAVPRCANSAR